MKDNKNKIFESEWSKKCGEILSRQVSLEYTAFYFYTQCYEYFNRRDVCLKGLALFFKKQLQEELEHALKIVDFMNKRNFKVEWKPIEDIKFNFESVSSILLYSKNLEEEVLANINITSFFSDKEGDLTICQFLEDYIKEQVESIYEFNDLYVNSLRCKEGHSLFLFDDALLRKLLNE